MVFLVGTCSHTFLLLSHNKIKYKNKIMFDLYRTGDIILYIENHIKLYMYVYNIYKRTIYKKIFHKKNKQEIERCFVSLSLHFDIHIYSTKEQ